MWKQADNMTHRRPIPAGSSYDDEETPRLTLQQQEHRPPAATTKAAVLEQRRRRRRRRPDSWSKTSILICIGLAEMGIYYLYRYGSMTWVDTIIAGPFANLLLLSTNGQKKVVIDRETIDIEATLARTSKALGYSDHHFDPLHISPRDDSAFYKYSSKEEMGVNYTLGVLESMGVNRTELVERGLLDEIPPWWQILDNYGNEPIVLGLERCQIFRERVHRRIVAPAGIFSSGTNLLQQLMVDNCVPPLKGQRPRGFNLFQVPWGKHNPASARLHHIAVHLEFQNQSAVLPVVTVRHPYTWLYALCTHPYSLLWKHRPEYCELSLFLKFPVTANLASLKHHATTNGTASSTGNTIRDGNMTYDSLIHVWREWNLEYFQQQEYPMLMVRFEDLVFRPKQVIEQVCHCVGGQLGSEVDENEPFWYLQESANLGQGHGEHRSDLVSAVIRYGRPLSMYHHMYSKLDWSIIHEVLGNDGGLSEALGYKL